MVCGPRCVEYVLGSYGRQIPLIRLVDEMSGTNLDQGTSLDALRRSLIRHGVYAQAISLRGRYRVHWKSPVIMHLKYTSSLANKLGHFVVLLPESDMRHAHVWNGLNGIEVGTWDNFSGMASDVALLTSSVPISDADALRAVQRRFGFIEQLSTVVFCSLVCILFLTAWPRSKRSTKTISVVA